ncbi:Transport protein [Segniliparus rotundus DSM 44985]|uniref:Transport protein n=1 Tax=Segniliparus rotundus (strain ATCC BAA-972 / CDC 1076 / CIP 108378 / DSM 44985 / JCM 13578) TaxID=640132 RepID=D6ZCF7_SEGRD|nr:MMPL family transporter [Segniliparus rotundus]ADG99126.1 Transport protein [Segniliparus rotundus DSM 44985]
MSTPNAPHAPVQRSRIARALRHSAPLVVILWLVGIVLLNIFVPQLEAVGKENSVSLASKNAPSYKAIKRQGELFHQFDSDSIAMVLLEDEKKPLGDDARQYYAKMVQRLQKDTKHVEHVQDFWGARTTAGGVQSTDGKAAYVQVNLVGDQGTNEGKESVQSVSNIVNNLVDCKPEGVDCKHGPKADDPPPGVKVYVTGQAPLTMDMNDAGDKSMIKMTLITLGVIVVMLLAIYRSIFTTLLIFLTVIMELSAARGVVAFLGHTHIIGLSTFATNLLVALAIAAGTDYAIFFVGRYHEARGEGEDRISAFFTTYHSVSHVVLGSGLTIAGATYCLSFTNLPYFQSLAVPCAIGMLVVVAAAMTLMPAVLLMATKIGLMESKSKNAGQSRTWRRIGTAIARWPGPILVVTIFVALIGLSILPSYRVNYNDRDYIPATLPSKIGFLASDKHFSKARMNPDIMLIETDQNLATPANMLVLDRIAKNVIRIDSIGKVQSITRPLGAPIDHSSIPFQVGAGSTPMRLNMDYLKSSMRDMKKMATEDLGTMISTLEQMYAVTKELTEVTHHMTSDTAEMVKVTSQMRDSMSYLDDYMRPFRNYFYWETNCWELPWCWAGRSLFDALDGIDRLTDQIGTMYGDIQHMDTVMPKMLALIPPMIDVSKSMQHTMLSMYSTMNSMIEQMDRSTDTSYIMGQAFDQAKNDDFFYLPPEAFQNDDFKTGLRLMLSPDQKSAQMIVTHQGDPAGAEALATTATELKAAKQAVKGTPLEDAKIYLGGTAATYHDIGEQVKYDLMIAVISAMSLIFLIMLIITRSIVAAFTIVGTIAISLGSSFGLSVLIWQHLLHLQLHWFVMPFTVIILLAVGSDYNLLLVSRMKEELHGGLKTGMIRAIGGSGGVVTSAGVVFAFTMGSMITSDLIAIGQCGTSICLGLLFDTFIVRGFMTPSIASLLGRWFWWPMVVRKHATPLPPTHTPAAAAH